MKALFSSKLEVLDSFFSFSFFSSWSLTEIWAFMVKSIILNEVYIVSDLFWREESNCLVPYEVSISRSLTLVFLVWTWFLKTRIIVSKTCNTCPESLEDFLCICISALMCCLVWLEKINETFCPSLRGHLMTIAKRSSSEHLVGTKVLWGDP